MMSRGRGHSATARRDNVTYADLDDKQRLARAVHLGTRKPQNHNEFVKCYCSLEIGLKKLAQLERFEVRERVLLQIRNLLKAASTLFHNNHEYYLSKEIDTRVWKYGIYHFIANFKNEDASIGREHREALKSIIKMGVEHFQETLAKLCSIFMIDLKPVFARTGLLRTSACKPPSHVDDMVYRIFIYIGDMYRYRFRISKNPHDARMAKSMYTGARFCDSGKTRAYYQLGLIARSQRDIIGTVYNFTRAWHGNTPVEGAKQQLQMIYGDVSQWYSLHKKKFWYTRVKIADDIYSQEWCIRDSIWLRNPLQDQTVSNKRSLPSPVVPPSRRQHLEELKEGEIFSRFSGVFAHFLGMLYTNIGTENVEHVAMDLLVYFEGLFVVKKFDKLSFLMDVIGLIIFHINYLSPPERTKDNAPLISQKKHLRNVATDVLLGMVTILVHKMRQLMETHAWENPLLYHCSAAVHVWCNWAMKTEYLLRQLNKTQKVIIERGTLNEVEDDMYMSANFICTWFAIIRLIKLMVERNVLFPKLKLESSTDTQPLGTLPEQLILDGFADIMLSSDVKSQNYHYLTSLSAETGQIAFRFAVMLKFTSMITGSGSRKRQCIPVIKTSIDCIYSKKFQIMNVILKTNEAIVTTERKRFPDCNNARIIVRINQADVECEDDSEKELARYIEPTKMVNESELITELQLVGVRTEMIIRPFKVVLDTNTLIRNLEWIRILMQSLPSQIIIPTTVLLELRGLMKGRRTGESPRMSQKPLTLEEQKSRTQSIIDLGEGCQKALEFLHANRRFFKLVRIDGTDVIMHNYKTQKVFDKRFDAVVRNDDKILKTCQQLEAQDAKTRRCCCVSRIYRNTVLLTGDKSLRVRAYAQDIPACDVQAFANWIMHFKEKAYKKPR